MNKKKSLDQEAIDFMKGKESKKQETETEKALRRFYAGCALAGLIASGTVRQPKETVREAFNYAKFMLGFKE